MEIQNVLCWYHDHGYHFIRFNRSPVLAHWLLRLCPSVWKVKSQHRICSRFHHWTHFWMWFRRVHFEQKRRLWKPQSRLLGLFVQLHWNWVCTVYSLFNWFLFFSISFVDSLVFRRRYDARAYWNHDGLSASLFESFWKLDRINHQELFWVPSRSFHLWLVQSTFWHWQSRYQGFNVLGTVGSNSFRIWVLVQVQTIEAFGHEASQKEQLRT